MVSKSWQNTAPGSHIAYYSLMFFIAYAFKGQVHVFAGQVKILSHSSCRTSAILKYFCPLMLLFFQNGINNKTEIPNT